MSFIAQTPIRFAHVDPAGIVFYPRYFELLNGAVEDWFAQVVGVDFATLHLRRRLAVPTVRIETDFLEPCRLAEIVDIRLYVERLGNSSVDIQFIISVAGKMRLRGRAVLVCMSLETQRSVPWPDEMRVNMKPADAIV